MNKKRFSIVLAALILSAVVMMTSCDNTEIKLPTEPSEHIPEDTTAVESSFPPETAVATTVTNKYMRTHAGILVDTMGVSTDDVVELSTHIFEGRVIDISFEVEEYGKVGDVYPIINTTYTIQPTKIYKGEYAETYKLKIPCGICDIKCENPEYYKEEEQYKLLEEYYEEHNIKNNYVSIIYYDFADCIYPSLSGDVFLFALKEGDNGILEWVSHYRSFVPAYRYVPMKYYLELVSYFETVDAIEKPSYTYKEGEHWLKNSEEIKDDSAEKTINSADDAIDIVRNGLMLDRVDIFDTFTFGSNYDMEVLYDQEDGIYVVSLNIKEEKKETIPIDRSLWAALSEQSGKWIALEYVKYNYVYYFE